MRSSALAKAVARAARSVAVQPDYIPMTGGLDQVTAPLQRRPGTARRAQNFEAAQLGGYRRIGGYERFDGRVSPSDALYTILAATITGSPVVGNTLYGGRPGYLSLPGTSGNYASTPDSAALDITGDIDIRVKALCDDWTPALVFEFIDKMVSDASQFSYLLRLEMNGTLSLFWSENGSTLINRVSTAAVGAADGTVKWVRATLDVNNGAAGHDVKFYTSDDGIAWTQLGATVTTAGVTSVFAGTAELQVGGGRSGVAGLWAGKVYYAELRNGIGGTVVAKFDSANDANNGGITSFVSGTGETWTINQSGSPSAELTGGATTGVIIVLPGSMFVLTKVVGTFVSGENLNVGGPTIATATAVPVPGGASTPLLNAQYLNLAADQYRTDIAAVPGSGNVLGGVWFNDVNYAFRNNAGATAAAIYKSTAAGWVLVPLGEQISFTAASGDVDEGDTLTQGAVTATIKRVVITSGTLAAGTAAGRLIIHSRAGGNYASGAATTTGAGALTLSGAQTAITILPSGRYEFKKENFGGDANTTRIYGCDNVNKGFEFDGTDYSYTPIVTGMTADTPTHVTAHKKHLVFSFLGSVQHSGLGKPYIWAPVIGAAELGMGDTVTGFAAQPGAVDSGALAIYTRNRTSILYGTSSADWNLVGYRDELGAYAHTIQDVGFTVFLDDRGITDMRTTQAFGNFAHNALSNQISNLVNTLRLLAVSSCISRDLNQYRLFFTNKQAFYMTVVGGRVVGIMPILLNDVPRCAWSAEKNDGSEVIFFGSDDGFVYQMDRGTSFDGDDIEFILELAYNFSKSPRVIKRYRDAMLEITGSRYAAFSFGYSLGYGTADLAQPGTVALETSFSATLWDSFTWDQFLWDGTTLTPNILKMEGEAENYAIAISGVADYYAVFTLTGVVTQYTPRRRMR